jgi:hypothetical protein
MTRRSLIPFLLLGVACSGRSAEPPASTASATPPPTTMAAPSPMGATVEAEVVTMDAAAPSLTLREGDVPATRTPSAKDLKAGDRTIRVESGAAASLSGLKPGMRVRVSCSAAPAVVVQGPGAAGSAAPGASGSSGASASPGASMSPATSAASPGMSGASPGMSGASPATGTGGLGQCDSIVAVTPLEAAPAR